MFCLLWLTTSSADICLGQIPSLFLKLSLAKIRLWKMATTCLKSWIVVLLKEVTLYVAMGKNQVGTSSIFCLKNWKFFSRFWVPLSYHPIFLPHLPISKHYLRYHSTYSPNSTCKRMCYGRLQLTGASWSILLPKKLVTNMMKNLSSL